MTSTSDKSQAARPGFVFVGDHPAVDFANTLIVSNGELTDLLGDWTEIANWLSQAGLAPEDRLQISDSLGREAVKSIVKLRQDWTEEMDKLMAGEEVSDAFIEKLNSHLSEDLYHEILHKRDDSGFQLATSGSRLNGKKLALTMVARQIAHFLAEANPAYLHRCANTTSCVLYFYDTTKNHRRQWCSVATCGNRHKVAQFRRRNARSKE